MWIWVLISVSFFIIFIIIDQILQKIKQASQNKINQIIKDEEIKKNEDAKKNQIKLQNFSFVKRGELTDNSKIKIEEINDDSVNENFEIKNDKRKFEDDEIEGFSKRYFDDHMFLNKKSKKTIKEQFKELSPEMKALILLNIF